MTIKSILCIFGGTESEIPAANAAFLLAKAYNAHIRFLHLSPDPAIYAAMYGYGEVYACTALIDSCEKENQDHLHRAKRHILDLAENHHIVLDVDDPLQVSARFVHLTGHPDTLAAQEGRMSDLIIMGRGASEADAFYDSTLAAALFNTGRPVLLLPANEAKAPAEYKTIAIAWKGTLEAGRAMYNAIPFLEKADKVYVLTAEEFGESFDINAEAAIMDYLHAHKISTQGIAVAAGTRTPAEALLARAKELKADLLVMGAYGHSRFREMMLGGVTSYMLKQAAIPLLLSH